MTDDEHPPQLLEDLHAGESKQGRIDRELIEIVEAVVLINEYESQARSGDAGALLEKTAARARNILALLKENSDG